MKKHIAVLALLLALTTAVTCFLGASLSASKDAVTVTERIIRGDKSVVDGLVVSSVLSLDRRLMWCTDYTIGDTPQTETSFDFSLGKFPVPSYATRASADMQLNIPAGFTKGTTEEQVGISAVYRELYDSLPNGGEKSAKVRLADYYEYYPLKFNFYMSGIRWEAIRHDDSLKEAYDHIQNAMADYFRIPVEEEVQIEVSVSRNKSGNSVGFGMSSSGLMYAGGCASTHTSDTCFFAISPKNMKGGYVDTSMIRGGYGIYSIRYSTPTAAYETGIDVDSLKTVFALDSHTQVMEMAISADNKNLIALAQENDCITLYVIDLEDMSLVRKFTFDGGSVVRLQQGEGFVLLTFYDKLVLIDMIDHSDPFIAIQSPIEHINVTIQDLIDSRTTVQALYNGEKLVLTDFLRDNYGNDMCSFYVAVYTKDGIVFHGEYESSLDKNHLGNTSYDPSPHGEIAISVKLPES